MDNVAYFGLITQRENCAFKVMLILLNGKVLHRSFQPLRTFLSVKHGRLILIYSGHDQLGAIVPIQASRKHVKCNMPALILSLVLA